ncbi:hypothetical protein KPH14_002125 [Odynerus spinipes]|uniref:DUF7041 domain-containing protein n=1 Tax=Odynerus spinipes TaxID=1348599 RepID=A0AAD9RL51_9HYME|nr:hypothetical protein KPH14_002125 [Odynerus spinipes]
MTTRTSPDEQRIIEQNPLLEQQQLLQKLADLQDQLHCLQQEQPGQQGPQVLEINHNPPIMQNEIAAVVSYKLPNFWKSKPDLWFTQIEAGFRRRRIVNDRTKFDAVLEALDETAIAEISDIVMRPPEHRPYERLKENLIKRFTDSSERQLHSLLAEIELGLDAKWRSGRTAKRSVFVFKKTNDYCGYSSFSLLRLMVSHGYSVVHPCYK